MPEDTLLTLVWVSDFTDPQTQDPFYSWAQAAFDTWEEKEGVTLELIPVPDLGGAEEFNPDLLVGGSEDLEAEVREGRLADLSMDLSEYGEWAWYYETAQDMASAENGVYGVPFEVQTAVLWYDAEALAAAGIIKAGEEEGEYEAWEPESPEEFTDVFKKLRRADKEAILADLTDPLLYELVLRAMGGRLVTEEGNWVVESKAMDSALTLIANLQKQSQTGSTGRTTGTTAEEDEAQPKIPVISAAFAAPAETEREMRFAAMPAQTGSGEVSLVRGRLLEIPAASEDKELAFSFLCHMMSKEQYSAYLSETADSGVLCVRKDLQETMAESEENSYRQNLLAGAGLYHHKAQYAAAQDCVREMLEGVCANPAEAGIKEAKENFAEAMREALGEEACRPLPETEEEE